MRHGGERIEEIDALRAIAAVCVVMLHVLGYFLAQDSSVVSHWLEQAGVEVLRFSRQIFMFVTGLLLARVYRDRNPAWAGFLTRRGKTLLLPYAIWTAIYLWFSGLINLSPGNWLVDARTIMRAVLRGDGYYHLYYVVVTLQFYLVFPLLLVLARRLGRGRRTGPAAIVAGTAYLALMLFYARHPYSLPVAAGGPISSFAQRLWDERDRLVVSYFAYYFLGVLAGAELERWRELVRRRGGYFLAVGLASVSYLLYQLHLRVHDGGEAFGVFVSVFRPAMVLYSLAIIGTLFLAALWIIEHKHGPAQALYRGMRTLSPYTYGIYLAHPLVLTLLEEHVLDRVEVPLGKISPSLLGSVNALLIIPVWVAGVYATYRLVSFSQGTRLGEWLFGLSPRARGSRPPSSAELLPSSPASQPS